MPKLLFTPESARILARKSVEARQRKRQANLERIKAVACVSAPSQPVSLDIGSKVAKTQLSEDLLQQLALLRITPPTKLGDLRNTPDGEGRASLVARIADTAAKVYGWDQEKGNSLVIVGLVASLDPDNQAQASTEPAIDVESSPATTG